MAHPPNETSASPAERAALSRQLAEFLIELSIALHKHAMYPEGHPSLAPAAAQATERLHRLLADRQSLSLGVARTRLVIEGVATDPKNPVLRDLASRLHRHQLGAVTFRSEVTAESLRQFLLAVASEPERGGGEPLGLRPPDQRPQWPGVRLHPVSYDRLDFADREGDTEGPGPASSRAEQLWIGLAQAALAVSDNEAPADLAAKAEPSVVAKAIDQHARGAAYDQVIVGYLLQLAEELRTAGGDEAVALKRRLSELVSNLEEPTLNSLLQMGGDRQQRREFLLNASLSLSVDAVVDVVRAANDKREGQVVSQGLLRMLQKLAQHADTGDGRRRAEAETAIREQVTELIRDWSLHDPNPDSYRAGLEAMAVSAPLFAVSAEQQYGVEPKRIFQMALEADATGVIVDQAVAKLVNAGELTWVLETLGVAEAPNLVGSVGRQMAQPENVQRVLSEEPLDLGALDLLLNQIGVAGAEPMLDALVASSSAHSRRALLDRLVQFGTEVGPLAAARLSDPRWYVQRNMLVILGSLPARPEGFNAADFLTHQDPRVRREAIRILLNDPERRERAICHALADQDPRTVRVGLSAAVDNCPQTAIPLVVARTTPETPVDLRTLAVRVLGNSRHRVALDALLRLVAPRRRLFRSRPPAKSPEYLAAVTALHQFPDNPAAQRALSQAARSKDAEIVRAAVAEGTSQR